MVTEPLTSPRIKTHTINECETVSINEFSSQVNESFCSVLRLNVPTVLQSTTNQPSSSLPLPPLRLSPSSSSSSPSATAGAATAATGAATAAAAAATTTTKTTTTTVAIATSPSLPSLPPPPSTTTH